MSNAVQFKRAKRDEESVNLTPLIDVVFLLLIFFMVSTTFTKEAHLKINLPKATGEVASEASGGYGDIGQLFGYQLAGIGENGRSKHFQKFFVAQAVE